MLIIFFASSVIVISFKLVEFINKQSESVSCISQNTFWKHIQYSISNWSVEFWKNHFVTCIFYGCLKNQLGSSKKTLFYLAIFFLELRKWKKTFVRWLTRNETFDCWTKSGYQSDFQNSHKLQRLKSSIVYGQINNNNNNLQSQPA